MPSKIKFTISGSKSQRLRKELYDLLERAGYAKADFEFWENASTSNNADVLKEFWSIVARHKRGASISEFCSYAANPMPSAEARQAFFDRMTQKDKAKSTHRA